MTATATATRPKKTTRSVPGPHARPEQTATTVVTPPAPVVPKQRRTKEQWEQVIRDYRAHSWGHDLLGRCQLCKIRNCTTEKRLIEILRSNPATAHIPDEL